MSEQAPEHCGLPMYRDVRGGVDMGRYLCLRRGCDGCISEDTLNRVLDMAWAQENGIALPGVTIISGIGGPE